MVQHKDSSKCNDRNMTKHKWMRSYACMYACKWACMHVCMHAHVMNADAMPCVICDVHSVQDARA